MLKSIQQLERALRAHLRPQEAADLAGLLSAALAVEMLSYETIDLPPERKNDCILMAFEERMLIPVKSGSSPAWEDRKLGLHPAEAYFMPLVVRRLVENAGRSGSLDPEQAVRDSLAADAGDQTEQLVRFFRHIKRHAPSYSLEAGLLGSILRPLGISRDLHDVIDLFVICGIISPCSRGPMAAGLAWYEVNTCLYWTTKGVSSHKSGG